MDTARAIVKARLLSERKQLRSWQGQMVYLCLCDLCGKANPTDLHECVISRRPTQMNDALQALILTSPYNLNLLCNDCNVRLAEQTRWLRFLVGKNVIRYGAEPIITWLGTLPMTDVNEYVLLVQDIALELKQTNIGLPKLANPPKPPKPKPPKARKPRRQKEKLNAC